MSGAKLKTSMPVRTAYLDVLRILATALVVMVHVSGRYIPVWDAQDPAWYLAIVYNCVAILGVPLFVMISGALLLDENYPFSTGRFWRKNILRLALCYYGWLGFYNTLPFFRGDLALTFENIKHQVEQVLIGKGIYHLWFIPMLLGLYILTPVLRPAFAKREICEYALVIYLVVGCACRPALLFDFPHKDIFSNLYDGLSLTVLQGYIGFYLLGHYLHSFCRVEEKTAPRRCLPLLIVAGVAFNVYFSVYESTLAGYTALTSNDPLSVGAFFACAAIFCLARYLSRGLGPTAAKRLRYLSSLSFGVYLLHPLMLQLFYGLFERLPLPPVLAIPLGTLATVAVCALLTAPLKKIPVLSRWLL